MKANEFIEMMRQDVATDKNKNHKTIVEVMELVITQNNVVEIEQDGEIQKTPQGCYKFLEEYAKKNKTGNAYFMSPAESMQKVADYLGVTAKVDVKLAAAPSTVDLEDFF